MGVMPPIVLEQPVGPRWSGAAERDSGQHARERQRDEPGKEAQTAAGEHVVRDAPLLPGMPAAFHRVMNGQQRDRVEKNDGLCIRHGDLPGVSERSRASRMLGVKGPALRPVGAHLLVTDALKTLRGVGLNRLVKYTR